MTTASPNRAPTLVPQTGNLRQGQIRAVGHQAVAQAGAVDEQGQAAAAAGVVQRRQLRLGVQGASLGGVGDVDHAGLDDMLSGFVVAVPVHIVRHLLGRDLAVVGGQGDDLVAGGLDGAGLVAVDVAADGGQNALPGAEDGGNDRGVGLGAAHQEVDIGLRRLAGGPDLLPGGVAVLVLAVAHGLHHIRFVQLCHQGGVGTLQIIAVEIDHRSQAPFLWKRNVPHGRSVLWYVKGILP